MANKRGHMLTDIKVDNPNRGLAEIMAGPEMEAYLLVLGADVVARYQAKVARRTGKLMASAHPTVVRGGHKGDRRVLKVTIGGPEVATVWKGKPFYYGVLHDLGSPTKRDRFPGAKDLKAVRDLLEATKGV